MDKANYNSAYYTISIEVMTVFECYEEFRKFFSNRLYDLRMQQNVSARKMSNLIGMGDAYINTIENNKSMPKMEQFYFICDYLKISPSDFFDEGNSNPQRLAALMEDLKSLSDEQLATVAAVAREMKKSKE